MPLSAREGIVAVEAEEEVVAGVAEQDVVPADAEAEALAADVIVAGTAVDLVAAAGTVEEIVAVPAENHVVVGAAPDAVRTGPAVQRHRDAVVHVDVGENRIVERVAGGLGRSRLQRQVLDVARQQIGAGAGPEDDVGPLADILDCCIGPGMDDECVVAGASLQPIGPAAAVQRIVAAEALQQIVLGAALKNVVALRTHDVSHGMSPPAPMRGEHPTAEIIRVGRTRALDAIGRAPPSPISLGTCSRVPLGGSGTSGAHHRPWAGVDGAAGAKGLGLTQRQAIEA